MFTGITWKDYLIAVTLILIAYYAAVLCWLYLDRLKVLVKSKELVPDQHVKTVRLNSEDNNALPREVQQLIALIKENIAQCFKKGLNREQLLKCISKVLSSYPSLKNSSFREHINQSIINECNKYGPVGLRNDELMGLWKAKTLQTVL